MVQSGTRDRQHVQTFSNLEFFVFWLEIHRLDGFHATRLEMMVGSEILAISNQKTTPMYVGIGFFPQRVGIPFPKLVVKPLGSKNQSYQRVIPYFPCVAV